MSIDMRLKRLRSFLEDRRLFPTSSPHFQPLSGNLAIQLTSLVFLIAFSRRPSPRPSARRLLQIGGTNCCCCLVLLSKNLNSLMFPPWQVGPRLIETLSLAGGRISASKRQIRLGRDLRPSCSGGRTKQVGSADSIMKIRQQTHKPNTWLGCLRSDDDAGSER